MEHADLAVGGVSKTVEGLEFVGGEIQVEVEVVEEGRGDRVGIAKEAFLQPAGVSKYFRCGVWLGVIEEVVLGYLLGHQYNTVVTKGKNGQHTFQNSLRSLIPRLLSAKLVPMPL